MDYKYVDLNGGEIKPTEKIIKWVGAMVAASNSKPTPLQSNYNVKTGGITKKGNIVFGSNHEIGITETATHGEEAVIVQALDSYGIDDPLEVIAFFGVGNGTPCGNCRDVIKQYTDLSRLTIVSEYEDRKIVVVNAKEFYKDKFEKASEEEYDRISKSEGLLHALIGEEMAYGTFYLNQETSPSIYGVAIVTEGGIFNGSFRGDVAYHPVYPISSAIENFRSNLNNNNHEMFYIREIVIASTGKKLEVMYKDRQHLLEFVEGINALHKEYGKEKNIPVYLVKANLHRKKYEISKTNAHEMLPLSFSPTKFGLEDKLKEYYKKVLDGVELFQI